MDSVGLVWFETTYNDFSFIGFNVLIVSRKSILAGLHVFVLYNVILIFVIVHEVWHFNKIFIYLSIYLVTIILLCGATMRTRLLDT